MHLVFDIFQGIGVAAAIGIRPFLPALATGALAAAGAEIHFTGTHFSFLQSAPFLLALAVAAITLALIERRLGGDVMRRPEGVAVIGLVAAALGALMFAGSLARGRYEWWPGLAGGVLCAAVGIAATAPLLQRVAGRLGESSTATLSLLTEIAAIVIAALSVVAPPVGPIALVLLLWLLQAGRRRESRKYAGLRILR